MNQIAKQESTELATIEDKANVVAIQLNTDVIKFSKKPSDVDELIKAYDHLKTIKDDDQKEYDSLIEIIAVCRTTRTALTKEKKPFKDPVIAFGKVVEKRLSAIIDPLQKFEDELKDEKQRIDEIKAAKKAAIKERELRAKQKQLDNLNELRELYADTRHMSIEALNEALSFINSIKLIDTNYGEFLEDAEKALVSARIRVNNAIAQAEQAEELRLKQEKLEKEQEERESRDREEQAERRKQADDDEAERQLVAKKAADEKTIDDQRIADDAAASQKVIDDQAALIKKMKQDAIDAAEAAKPKIEDPEPEVVSSEKFETGGIIGGMPDDEFINKMGIPKVTPFDIGTAGNDVEDIEALRGFIVVLQEAASKAPVISNNTLSFELARVKTSIGKACEHIEMHIAKVEK